MKYTDWEPEPGLECKCGREVWTHEAPNCINDGEVDGEIDFPPEVLEGFED